MNKPVALIDVDNTISPFHTSLYELIKRENPKVPHWSRWDDWYFYKKCMDDKTFYGIVDMLHSMQESVKPYDRAKELLDIISKKWYIVIASHRKTVNKAPLINWLDKNNLRYDEVYCGMDKLRDMYGYYHDCVSLVIDDSPIVLRYVALDMGYDGLIYGIKFPWNRHLEGTIPLVDNLGDIERLLINEK